MGQLVAGFSGDMVAGCAPIRVIFTDTSTGNITDRKWDLGNGTTAGNSTSPSTTYLTPGVFTVKLVVFSGKDSAVVIKTNYITVYAIPTVNFSATPVAGCLPASVKFKDSSKLGELGPATYQWDFGDGILGTGQNPIHVYNSPGQFKVTLTIKNGSGCIASDSRLSYITVFDSVSADFGIQAPQACAVPAVYKFTDSSEGAGIKSRLWDFGDGTTSLLTNPTHVYATQGNYSVKLIVVSNNGCTDTIKKVNAISAGDFKANFTFPASGCTGKQITFINTSAPISQVTSNRWTFGNGKTATTLNASTSFATAGTYKVKLVTSFGTCVDSIEQSIIIKPNPTAAFSATPTGSCKPPLDVKFSNMTVDGTVVKWILGNGTTSTTNNPQATYNDYGSYDVSLIVQNTNGCLDTLLKKDFININPPIISSIKGLPYEGCVPFNLDLSLNVNSPEPIVSYQWDFGDGVTSTSKDPSHQFNDTGRYEITAIITTASGCTDTLRGLVFGGVKPTANFVASPNIVCPLDPVVFNDLSTGNQNKWYWEFGDGGTSTDASPSYLYKDTGFMTVKFIAYNNGCSDTLIRVDYVYVYPPIARFIDSFACSDPFTIYLSDNSKGGTYWKWYLGGLDSIEAKNTVFTFPDTGTYSIKLYIEDSLCVNHTTRNIRIINEKAFFVAVDSPICGLSYKRFDAIGPQTHPANIVNYKWDFGDGTILETDTSSVAHVYNKSGPVNVTLIITDIYGCMDTTTLPLDVRLYGPVANFSPRSSRICAGSLITFKDSSSYNPLAPILKWTWNVGFGNDTTTIDSSLSTIYNVPGVYDVKMIVEDSLGCTSELIKKRAVIVYKPSANFFSADTIICVNSPVQFTDQSSGVQVASSWSFGDGKVSTVANPSTVYTAAGKYDVKLVISDSLNCTDTMLKPTYISVQEAKADFDISDSFTTCPPLVVTFTNKSANNLVNSWDFNNGNTSSLENPIHTYTTPGTFNAKLIVSGNGGCTDSVTRRIKIEGPYGTFSYGPLIGCPPLKVLFTSDAENTNTITWDFSDGESKVNEDSTITHDYRIPGRYVPKVILSDGVGCRFPVQGLDTINIIGVKTFIADLPEYKFCDSAIVQFLDTTVSTELVESYKWNFGDGTQGAERNPVHSYNTPGNYLVSLEVTTKTGCKSTDDLPEPVKISRTPKVTISPEDPVCVPAVVQHEATWINKDTSRVTWNWQFSAGQTSSAFKPQLINYDRPGSYIIRFTASNIYGCSDTTLKTLVVNDTPRIVAGPGGTICLGSNIALLATGGATYKWDKSNTLSCLDCVSPVASPLTQEIYRVLATDSNGCRSSDTVQIKVMMPGLLRVGPPDTLCIGESVNLFSSGFQRYSWSPPDGLSSVTIYNPVSKPLVTTNYQVIGTDTLNCFRDTGYIPIAVYPIPEFNILEDKIAALTGSVVNIATTSSPDIIRWHWTPPTGLSCTNCAQPDVTISTSITYTAVATNAGLCRTTDRVTIVPICNSNSVYIPNTFSPNNDGQNDIFYPRGKGVSLIKSMRIFNRWGELMYEHRDFALNDPGAGWNGTYKGVALTPDVYVYLIDVLCDNAVQYNLKGNVTLLK